MDEPPLRPYHPPSPRARATVILVAVLGACLVLAVAVAVPVLWSMRVVDGFRTVTAPEEVDLSAVEVYDDLPLDHAEGSIDYPTSPPPGGQHNPSWLDCGIYETPIPDEFAVHSLEHGTVWITHDPDLAAEDIVILQEILPSDGILSPYPGQPAPVVVTVWGRQLLLDSATDPRLELFIAEYGDGHTSLEPHVTCHGGLGLEEAEGLLGGLRI